MRLKICWDVGGPRVPGRLAVEKPFNPSPAEESPASRCG
jgi:hypothetical protein